MGLNATEERRQRKQALLQKIKDNPDLPLRKIAGLFSMQTGLTSDTVIRMIKELVDVDMVQMNEGLVKPLV